MTSSPIIMWLGKLTSVFFRNAPIATVVVVLLTLFSQISMMLATLLPLKVVMLLGSDGVPRFFPSVLLEIDRNKLVISLVMLSIASYIFSVIFMKISEKMTEQGIKKLLEKTQKIILFENQDKIASNAYTKYTIALAGLIFFLATISVFTFFYQAVAILIIVFLLIAHTISYMLYVSISSFEARFSENANTLTSSISNIGFLLIFIYIVIDFLYFSPPHFLVGLAAIILGRLMLIRLSFTASYLFSLKKEEPKINALFFHNQVFIPSAKTHRNDIWDLLPVDSENNNWLLPVLEEATSRTNLNDANIEWQQSRLYNILLLKVTVEDKTFLIKLFEEKIVTQAMHESTLMVEIEDTHFPCAPFLLTTKVNNYHCHIFDITGYEFLRGKEAFLASDLINQKLLTFTPSDELVERYSRSKAFLWERIEIGMLERLKLLFNQNKTIILAFENALPEIRSILQKLPLSFVNPKLNNTSLLTNAENKTVSIHWSAWTIEPAGAGLNFSDEKITEIHQIIKAAHEIRPQLKKFPTEYYVISCLISSVEQSYQLQQYEDVIRLIPLILEHLKQVHANQGKAY